jgi:DNA-directed RNA polymerase I, II, and III subunit RPABC1
MKSRDYFLRLKQNQIRMVRERGYDVSSELWILDEMDGKKFEKKLAAQYEKEYPLRKLMFSEYEIPNDRNLVVYYVCADGSKQIKIDSVQPFIKKIKMDSVDGILIVDQTLSSETSHQLTYITQTRYQIFNEDFFNLDLVEHLLVPRHIAMTKEETDLFYKKHGPRVTLGRISVEDPVAKYYGFKTGQLIKLIGYQNLDVLQDTEATVCIISK